MKIESVTTTIFRHTTNTVRDSDGHGGQQYAPLMEIEIPGQ